VSAGEALTVSQVLQSARTFLESRFGSVLVSGEVTGLKVSTPGHMYFSLKDERSVLPCVFFRSANAALAFRPEDGMKVVAAGSLTLYEARGQFQLNVRSLEPQGLGALQAGIERLKRVLSAEGLFDPARKKTLPRFPRRVALLTSPQGAALHDFTRILKGHPAVETVELFPVPVQGLEAPAAIVDALGRAGRDPAFDVLVLTRGGGSLEDLAAFNDEGVVRALAACTVPTVSAVGHETDVTLCDFAADARAATPSAAAALMGPTVQELGETILDLQARMSAAQETLLRASRREAQAWSGRLQTRHPGRFIADARQRLDETQADLLRACRSGLRERGLTLAALASGVRRLHPRSRFRPLRERLRELSGGLSRGAARRLGDLGRVLEVERARLDSVHPLAPLKRGYAVVTRTRDGLVLRDAAQAPAGEKVRIRLHRGELDSTVDASLPDGGRRTVQRRGD
jgi:exodeoxyribonuclease VII large subunit